MGVKTSTQNQCQGVDTAHPRKEARGHGITCSDWLAAACLSAGGEVKGETVSTPLRLDEVQFPLSVSYM